MCAICYSSFGVYFCNLIMRFMWNWELWVSTWRVCGSGFDWQVLGAWNEHRAMASLVTGADDVVILKAGWVFRQSTSTESHWFLEIWKAQDFLTENVQRTYYKYSIYIYCTKITATIPESKIYMYMYLRIDTHFTDIHGFMNVALVGAIPWTALAVHG